MASANRRRRKEDRKEQKNIAWLIGASNGCSPLLLVELFALFCVLTAFSLVSKVRGARFSFFEEHMVRKGKKADAGVVLFGLSNLSSYWYVFSQSSN